MTDTFRKEYKPLTDEQKADVEAVKDQADTLLTHLNGIVLAEERSERSRCIALAKTNLEQAVMWAVKGITA